MPTDSKLNTTGARVFRALLDQKLIIGVALAIGLAWGALVAPFGWWPHFARDTVPVDAIPDIGENQQIVFTAWPGRSPQDVDDQITYPLTATLLGIPHVRTIRSFSMLGFSIIYVVFAEGAEFYWTRARITEKLAALPRDLLPPGVTPNLGPDATALGQIFWYTLESVDQDGQAVVAWDPYELRAIQDFQVRYALAAAEGVAEVASIGGFVKELQVDVDPTAMRAYDLTLTQVRATLSQSSAEVGAGTLEMNGVNYTLRSVGFVRSMEALAELPVGEGREVAIRLGQIARIGLGPAMRDGALTRSGAEAVGGVVTARFGANPRQVIANVRAAIAELEPSLPTRVLDDGRTATLRITPFYDRTSLIDRTVATLSDALTQQILITILVVVLLMLHLRATVIIASLLPAAVLLSFGAMFSLGVDANVVALAGIAIAIGTMVDIAIVLTENIAQRLEERWQQRQPPSVKDCVAKATAEVAGAVWTAVATTVVSFLPVFFLEGQEGKLFSPLAYTKTFALVASLLLALLVIPPAAQLLLGSRMRLVRLRHFVAPVIISVAVATALFAHTLLGVVLVCYGLAQWFQGPETPLRPWHPKIAGFLNLVANLCLAAAVAILLAELWLPLGAAAGHSHNVFFVAIVVGGLLLLFRLFQAVYRPLLLWVLEHRGLFLTLPITLIVFAICTWLGFGAIFGWLPERFHRSDVGQWLHHALPGMGREFMPYLDEGTFLYMPSAMPHASMGEMLAMSAALDRRFETIPEVEYSVGKIGRTESPLDPAPIAMLETIIHFAPEYILDDSGRIRHFAVDAQGQHRRDASGELIPDPDGLPFRNWRPHIKSAQDIWDALVAVADVPGLTGAPKLQPISTRIVMLQSGIRAPMAVRLRGSTLENLGAAALAVEAHLRDHPMVNPVSVLADRPVGTPYLEIHPKRTTLARYGMSMAEVQERIEIAIGGMTLFNTIEGRERFPVRVRFPRELRDSPEAMATVLIEVPGGARLPLGDLAELRFVAGPEMIRSEDATLVAYVLFDRHPGQGEVQTVQAVQASMEEAIRAGRLTLPEGVSFSFAGSYENSLRAEQRLALIIPLSFVLILLLLYLNFRSLTTTFLIFSGVAVAFSGGFLLLWLYGQPWFLDFTVMGHNLREVFHIIPTQLSVAVWVGFIALFGIATDDGVVMATYLRQRFAEAPPTSIQEIRARVTEAGERRIRPCLMTTATTILALLPILTSTGTGADVMIPMALPAAGGMSIALITLFVVPALYCAGQEWRLRLSAKGPSQTRSNTSTTQESS